MNYLREKILVCLRFCRSGAEDTKKSISLYSVGFLDYVAEKTTVLRTHLDQGLGT